MERQVYQRRSFIPKVCIECKKEFQAQRKTAMYCGAGCLQAHRNRRLAGHQQTMKVTRAMPTINHSQQNRFQNVTIDQCVAYILQLEQYIVLNDDRQKRREEHFEEQLKSAQQHFEKIIAIREKQLNEVIEELLELRKLNKMWELGSKILLGK